MWNNHTENWHALFVYTGREHTIRDALEAYLGDEISFLVPQRELRERKAGKWRRIKRNLFPGYILLKGDLSIDNYYRIKELPVLAKVLRDEDGPLRIREEELEVLNVLIDNQDGNIDISTAYKEDEEIKVVEGPLLGLEGRIESVNVRKGRARVRLEFLGDTRLVDLGLDFIDKI